jgi:AcrR family transcriptional regulator
LHDAQSNVACTFVATTEEDLGRRERKKRETRRALEDAALRLANERGPDNVTVEEIADAADVSVRTFFNYFSSKEEAIVGGDGDATPLVEHLLARPVDEPPLVAVGNVLVGAFVTASEEWADRRVVRQRLVRKHPSLLPRHLASHHGIERQLTKALAARLGMEDADFLYPALVVTTAVNAMRLAIVSWDASGRTVPVHTVIEQAMRSLERGLPLPEDA